MPRVVVPVTDLTPPKAALTTALAGTNNDLVFTAKNGGPGGNSIRIQYVVAGTSTALSIDAQGFDIIVNVATDGAGAATSTAAQIKTAIDASPDASRLVSVANAAGNDGSGVVAALALTALSGGGLAVTPPTQTDGDATNGHYLRGSDGLVELEATETGGAAQTVTIEFSPVYASLVKVTSEVVTIPASSTRYIPLSVAAFNQNALGDVYFVPSVATTVKFRAYRAVRAA